MARKKAEFHQRLEDEPELRRKVEGALEVKSKRNNENIATTIYSSHDFLGEISSEAHRKRDEGLGYSCCKSSIRNSVDM